MEKEKRVGDTAIITRFDPYEVAWARLVVGIEDKTTWGRNELKDLMLHCLTSVGREV